MRTQVKIRLVAATLFSSLAGARIAHDVARKHRMGHDGYLQYQDHYWNKYLAEFHHPLAHGIGYAVFIAVCVAIYELIAFGIGRLLSRNAPLPL